MSTQMVKPAKPPIPGWAWIFAIACGIIPIVTLGGAIQGAIGFGGAAGCIAIARNPFQSPGARVALCIAITIACWFATFAILGAIIMFQHMNR